MKTIRQADIAAGIFLALLGIFILYSASNIRIGVERSLSPRFFPSMLGFIIFACGAGLAFKSWRFRGEDPAIHWPDRQGAGSAAVIVALLAVYIVLMKPLGLPISTFLYVTASIWFLKPGKWGIAIAAGLALGVISYVVFIRLLELSFPVGFLLEAIGLY